MSGSHEKPVGDRQKKSRKQRQPKACYPCRQRKVKCHGVPCRSCVLRGQPQLCSMEPQSILVSSPQSFHSSAEPAFRSAAASDASPISNRLDTDLSAETGRPRSEPERRSPNLPLEMEQREQPSPACDMPSHSATLVSDDATMNQFSSREASSVNDWSHLHADNVPTSGIQSQASPERLDQLWSRNIFELVSNGSDVVLPFEDLYSHRRSIAELCLALPSNIQIQRYYTIYSDILLPMYPIIVYPELFESQVQSFLENRDQILVSADKHPNDFPQHDASWFALLFAVLSSGAQCLSTIDREAELNAKVFGSVSLSCLRKSNFLVSPTINSIQALLHIGNTLRNDMNPGVAWSILGLTIRLAQMLGCHKQELVNDKPCNDLATMKIKLWWAVVAQDIVLALCYDHPSGTIGVRAKLPPVSDPSGYYTLTDVTIRICDIALQLLRQQLFPEETESLSCDGVHGILQQMDDVCLAAHPHLFSVTNCISLRQHVEHFVITILKNHAVAQFLQMRIKGPPAQNLDVQHEIHNIVLEKSVEIIESFIKLRQLSMLWSHYWSVLQASVTAAKLLVTQGRAADRQKVAALVKAFILSLRSSCDETISVVNGFSTTLSQTVSELTKLLDA